MITNKFNYSKLSRTSSNGKRVYVTPTGDKVPSVTTILEVTKPAANKLALQNWRKRVGPAKAAEITSQASGMGTRMHKYLEDYVTLDILREPGSNPYSIQSNKMAKVIIDEYIAPHITEFFGNEISLHYPQVYAGTTDMVSLWDHELAIVDFKQTNKKKLDAWVEDYRLQLAAYILAHDELYNTKIGQGVILMCSQNFEPQHWIINGIELERCKEVWARRVEEYFNLN
jgi:genome maintenance exonuclease 1